MFDRPEQLHASVVHNPQADILPAETIEEAEPTTDMVPVITGSLISIEYRPPARRPHRVIPAGPPVPASAHLGNLGYVRMEYSYHWSDKLGAVVAAFAGALGVTMGIFGWIFLQGGSL